MADLEFKHSVQEIPAGARLPESVKRSVSAEVTSVPDIQSAVNTYAANTNWMSTFGASVAAQASNAIATRIGGELGKNPQGDIGLSLTDFDTAMKESYATQAQSTLGLQAQKLITQSNLELAAQPRISASTIAKAQQEVFGGLKNIYSLAPQSIRPQMEHQYGSIMLQQTEHLTNRMLGEQKADRNNNTDLANKLNNQNAHSLALNGIGLDKNGDSLPGLSAVATVKKAYQAAVAMKDKTPLDAEVAIESAQISYLSGKYTRQALMAEKAGKLPEFLRSLADHAPDDIKDIHHTAVINNVIQYMNEQQALRNQDQQLKMAQFAVKLAENPELAGLDLPQLQSELTPLQAQKVKLDLMQAMTKKKNDTQHSNLLSAYWDNPTVWANTTAAIQDKTFNNKVQYAIDQSGKTTVPLRSPVPLTRDQAEVMVATSAGGQIPVFTKTLQNKLKSSNPANIESALQQIHALKENANGQALSGLTDRDWSMFSAAQALRDSPDPIKANQDAHNRIYNQDTEVEDANKKTWSNILTKKNSAGLSNDQFALSEFNMKKSDFLNPTLANAYGTNILSKFSNFFAISGDYEEAKASTQRWVDENYGDTFINGGKHKTLNPIEKKLGFTGRDGVPYIQQNISKQLDEKLIPFKVAYDKKTANEYWETIPIHINKATQTNNNNFDFNPTSNLAQSMGIKVERPEFEPSSLKLKGNTLVEAMSMGASKNHQEPSSTPSQEHGILSTTYDPIKIKRHTRTPDGEKTDIFNVILIGNSFGDYDVSIETKEGMRSLFREAPYLGIMSVSPQQKEILDHYNHDHLNTGHHLWH